MDITQLGSPPLARGGPDFETAVGDCPGCGTEIRKVIAPA